MGSKKKRKRVVLERPSTHPRNKYSENPPDFGQLASLYPSFQPFVFYSRDGHPRIDWTNFNATRELTRVLLFHDHSLNWWIPDGQLCPTVPNRSNYIHWIEDLLSSDIITDTNAKDDGGVVRGFDIGTGANCIYPLLGASLLGWSFVGSDVTDVALDWAERNVKNNPHISGLIEIRKAVSGEKISYGQESYKAQLVQNTDTYGIEDRNPESNLLPSRELHSDVKKSYDRPPVLYGVIRDGEKFDFCMCNPPFFESMEEAGLNPKTSCGGTAEEMVFPGGEEAFISRIIQDSVELKQSIRWYTSMVGRKSNMKILISKLREVGVTIVKTTEFVQGQTCRWGLAWSFMPPAKKIISSHVAEKRVLSFMLEGLQRQCSAIHVLQSVETFFCSSGATCKLNASAFNLDITTSDDQFDAILKNRPSNLSEHASYQSEQAVSNGSDCYYLLPNNMSLRISVFQQIPGTLLVRGSLQHRESHAAGVLSSVFLRLEEVLKHKFCREKMCAGDSSTNRVR